MQTVRVCAVSILFSAFILGPPTAKGQSICYVDDSATGGNNGSSWENAYTDLQSAIANPNCNPVWVAAGTYLPTATRTGTEWVPSGKTFEFRPNTWVYGGFVGDEDPQTFDLADRDLEAHETILSGNTAGCYHVVTAYDQVFFALDGFTIRDGDPDGGSYADERERL